MIIKAPRLGRAHGVHCAGCGYSFEHYEMKASDGYEQDGKIYCNSECALDSEVRENEQAEWEELSADY